MSNRPSQPFVYYVIPLLVLGGIGAWAWHKASSVPTELPANATFPEAPKPKAKPATPEQLAEARKEAQVWKAKFVGEFPALKTTPRAVADEENGFLLLYKLPDPKNTATKRLPISDELEQILADQSPAKEVKPWDPDAAKRCLAEHSELVSRIESIASLTNRSSASMPPDYNGVFEGRTGKTCCDILLLKARLAAEAGDDAETLRLVAAAGNLGSHYHDVESPSFFSETVVIMIDLGIGRAAFSKLLPVLGQKADLDRWKAVLGGRSCTPADLAAVMRGEWDIGADYMTFPVLLASAKNQQLKDPEAVARVETAWFNSCVTRLPSVKLADLASTLDAGPDVSSLSKEGQQIIGSLANGLANWSKGYVRAAACLAQSRAVIDLLVLEKSGVKLTNASAEQITRDPVSGSQFVFDAEKRSLAAPSGTAALNVETLALPW